MEKTFRETLRNLFMFCSFRFTPRLFIIQLNAHKRAQSFQMGAGERERKQFSLFQAAA